MKAPSTIEAEMALVGAALSDNAVCERISLEASQFFDPVLGDMWAEIAARVKAGRGVNAVSITQWLRHRAPELANKLLDALVGTHLLSVHER